MPESQPGISVRVANPNPILFCPAIAAEAVRKHARLAGVAVRLALMARAIAREPSAGAYSDLALTRGEPEAEAKLELLAPMAAASKRQVG